MAKGNKGKSETSTPSSDESKKERNMADYVFEEHGADGSVAAIGLTMHYPSEAAIVMEYLESKREELGITGRIRICKKIYS
jgi:hypothetical protein